MENLNDFQNENPNLVKNALKQRPFPHNDREIFPEEIKMENAEEEIFPEEIKMENAEEPL